MQNLIKTLNKRKQKLQSWKIPLKYAFEDKDCLIGKWLLVNGYTETLLGPSEELSWCEKPSIV